MHDATNASGILLVWLVSDADPAYPGKFAARAYIADIAGSVFQDGALVAATLDKLRAQMPVGLTVRPREPFQMPKVLKTWECSAAPPG
jgi:hypothetical protein